MTGVRTAAQYAQGCGRGLARHRQRLIDQVRVPAPLPLVVSLMPCGQSATVLLVIALTLLFAPADPARADSTDARCDVYPAGEDHTDVVLPCRFYQAQGHVVITRSDGVEHDLSPVGDAAGHFRDQDGQDVYRQSGLGREGLVFRFPTESVFVYWNTALLDPQGERQPYEPASDLAFDAATWTPCRRVTDADFGQCPSGVLRMDSGEASVVIEDPAGQLVTINFLRHEVNSSKGSVKATLDGDTWTVVVGDTNVYAVDRALIEGG